MIRKVSIFILILAFSFLLISCKESSTTSPTTTTSSTSSISSSTTTTPTTSTTSTSSTTTTTVVTKPVKIRETGARFDTIGEAITAATAGQHIDVSAGTYNEELVINKHLYLVGADRNTTIIDGGGGDIVVGLIGSATQGSSIRGFTIRNGSRYGVLCEHTTLTVSMCTVESSSGIAGIMCHNSLGTIATAVVENNSVNYGIYLLDAAPTIKNCTVQGSVLTGIVCSEALSTPSISGCTITNNDYWGVYCCHDATPDLGGGASASPGNNTIRGNNVRDLYNATANPLKAEHNRWDHITAAEIDAQDIYDDDDAAGLGPVDFEPFLTTTSFASLRMRPRLLIVSSLFKDFFRSLFRSDLPASAMYLSSSFEPRLHITRFDLLEARYRSLVDERYYPPLMLRASR